MSGDGGNLDWPDGQCRSWARSRRFGYTRLLAETPVGPQCAALELAYLLYFLANFGFVLHGALLVFG